MRVTSKGQVTIPQAVRERAGIVAGSEIEFKVDGPRVYLQKVAGTGRGETLVAQMAGKGNLRMTTDEILALTRGSW